jgi:perosamine synthetase
MPTQPNGGVAKSFGNLSNTMDNRLALTGGVPILADPLPHYPSIGAEEEAAVIDTIRSGRLSGFFGSWGEEFLGGPKVRALESAWSELFGTEYVVSVNSNTSGLMAAIGACGISPGDEVIVPCTTMSATAVAPLVYGGIPVFADIDQDTFCIDIEGVRNNLSARTKAIIAVNLFGHPAPLEELRKLADERGIILIEDNAQAPLARENDLYCGTIGHVGVFSLNYHKHIHSGEGGLCCTNDANLAERIRLIRNHAEAVVGAAGVDDLTNLVGFNFRLTELSAAVALAQFRNIETHVARRKKAAESLSKGILGLEGVIPPQVRDGCDHVYYNWAMRYQEGIVGPSRSTFMKALQAEGFPCRPGYVEPLYMLPMFQRRKAIGSAGFPFNLSDRTYYKGQCPTAERLFENEFLIFKTCDWDLDETIMDRLIAAFRKVYENRCDLIEWERQRNF